MGESIGCSLQGCGINSSPIPISRILEAQGAPVRPDKPSFKTGAQEGAGQLPE